MGIDVQKKDANISKSVTLPAEAGQEAKVIELIRRWGVDAIRDSDGTQLLMNYFL